MFPSSRTPPRSLDFRNENRSFRCLSGSFHNMSKRICSLPQIIFVRDFLIFTSDISQLFLYTDSSFRTVQISRIIVRKPESARMLLLCWRAELPSRWIPSKSNRASRIVLSAPSITEDNTVVPALMKINSMTQGLVPAWPPTLTTSPTQWAHTHLPTARVRCVRKLQRRIQLRLDGSLYSNSAQM